MIFEPMKVAYGVIQQNTMHIEARNACRDPKSGKKATNVHEIPAPGCQAKPPGNFYIGVAQQVLGQRCGQNISTAVF